MTGFIYALVNPDYEVRYVGMTTHSLDKRLREHIRDSGRDKSHRARWIAKLLRNQQAPRIVAIQTVPVEHLREAEISWISVFKAAGFRLVNSTDGGGGVSGYRHNQETIERIRQKNTGKKRTQETCEKLRIANTGKKQSPETLARLSVIRRGRKHSAETLAKMVVASPGKRVIKDQDGTIYSSTRAAAAQLGISSGAICNVLKRRRESVHGYVFTYVDSSGSQS